MAAGRYVLDHTGWDFWNMASNYPETGTFTFSPVTDSNFTAKTWFGDIVLHLTYDWFGFLGLQFLRASFIISAVLFMLHLVKFRYNLWTLLVSAMMIIGTMQKHLIKNAIIIIPAMSFIAWSWVQFKYHKKYYWIAAYPLLFLIWRPFHGSVMVGASFIFAIMTGEILDFIISHTREYLHKKTLKKFFSENTQYFVYTILLCLYLYVSFYTLVLLVSAAILIAIYTIAYHTHPEDENFIEHIRSIRSPIRQFLLFIVIAFSCATFTHQIYQLPMLRPLNPAFQMLGIIDPPRKKIIKEGTASIESTPNQTQESTFYKIITFIPNTLSAISDASKRHEQKFKDFIEQITNDSTTLKARLKKVFRIFFGGTDAKLVAEYQWPLEITYVLSVKALFLLSVIYACYLIFRLSIGAYDFRLSIEMPTLALVYLSMGYLRTLSYPFASAFIFITFSFFLCAPVFKKGNRALKGWLILGMSFLLLILWSSEPLLAEFVKLFFDALKDANIRAKDARYLAVPLLLIPILTGLLLLIKDNKILNKGVNLLFVTTGTYLLACLLYFAYYENNTYQKGDFHTVTGFLDTEPGLGKSNKFNDGMAEIVQKELPPKNIYNTYNMGGYLLWKWYLERKVFIDGRSIIYNNDFYQSYTTNNAQQYIVKEDLEHAILNMVVDKDRIMLFAKQGWYPIHFDPGMTIMKKPKTFEEPFGVLPVFHKGEREIEDLENLDRTDLGNYFNIITHHMLLFGRVKDTHDFLNKHKDIIEQLPADKKKQITERLGLTQRIGKMYGLHNHRAMATLAQKLFKNVKGAEHHFALAEAFYELRKLPQAEAQYVMAYQKKKDDFKILKRLGEVLYLNKKYKDSVSIINQAAQKNPKDAAIHNLMMLPLIELKQYDQALAFGQKAVQLNPKFAEAFFNAGRVYLLKNDHTQAYAHFKRSLELKPNFKEAQNIIKQMQSSAIQQQKATQDKKKTEPQQSPQPLKKQDSQAVPEKK
jgi:Flp pilus assembly protein TadD